MSMLLHHFTLLLVSCLHALVFFGQILFLDLKVTLSDDKVNPLSFVTDQVRTDI